MDPSLLRRRSYSNIEMHLHLQLLVIVQANAAPSGDNCERGRACEVVVWTLWFTELITEFPVLEDDVRPEDVTGYE